MRVLTFNSVPPVRKYPLTDGDKALSSTNDGSAAPSMPEVEAGPSKPMVAKLSSAKSGTSGKKAALIPEAFQLALKVLLKMFAGVVITKFDWSLPNTAENLSVGSLALT